MTTFIIIILLVALIAGIICSPRINLKILMRLIRPRRSFESHIPPPLPDYSDPDHWSALPFRKDVGDQVPGKASLKNNQEQAKVDVFYIHRTTLLSGSRWNADVENKNLNRRTDKEAVRNQATIFNGSCKIYAPRYRQATLYSFFDRAGHGKQALDLAYQDVKAAFRHYLRHYHHGRPVVIAAHSQGAEHATRLLKDFFDGKELLGKLVVAYLIGMPIRKDTFKDIPPGESPDQTGCFTSWSTFGRGISPNYFQEQYRTAVCTNPLTWDSNQEHGGYGQHLGSVPIRFRRIDRNIIDARCANGVLWIKNRKPLSYIPLPLKNYVTMDLDLFYMNVRENVKLRIDNHLGSPHS